MNEHVVWMLIGAASAIVPFVASLLATYRFGYWRGVAVGLVAAVFITGLTALVMVR